MLHNASDRMDGTLPSANQSIHEASNEPAGSIGDARVDMDFLSAYQLAPTIPSCDEPAEVRKNVFSDEDHEFENEVVPAANFLTVWALIKMRRALALAKRVQVRRIELDFHVIQALPLDILYEILWHLEAIDLYHLSQTNLAFKILLEGPGYVPTWEAAFHSDASLPNPPDGVSYHKWADVLFGRLNCETCGAAFAVIDFAFAERRCYDCAEKALTTCDDFEACSPGSVVWTLITPCYLSVIYRSEFDHFTPGNQVFRITDVMETMSLVEEYKKNIVDSKEAEEAYDAFKSSRLSVVQSAAEHREACYEWARQIAEDIRLDYQRVYDRSYDRIARYFVRDSYILSDVVQASLPRDIITMIKMSRHRRWTRARWNRIKPLLEPVVSPIRQDRLRAERLALVEAREKIVKDVYAKFRESTLPATWSYHPPAYTVLDSEHFRGLINDPSDSPLTAAQCSEAAEHLPQLVEQWTMEKMNQLASFLPSNAFADPPDLFDLELATSVFHCLGSARSSITAGRCLIGWDGAAPHLRCGALQNYWDHRLHFCQRGYDSAKALVELLKMDPATALAREMDVEDHRFLCANCSSTGLKRNKAMIWRDCVLHYIESEDDCHSTPRWTLLTPVVQDVVKRREGPDPYVLDSDWCCNHCPTHWNVAVTRSVAIRHCKEVHEIERPVENLDFIYFVSTSRRMRQPVTLLETAEYLCQECPSRKAKRLYPLISLTRHLQDKHAILKPVEGRSYRKVQIIALSSPEATSEVETNSTL